MTMALSLPPVLIDPGANQANGASPLAASAGPRFCGPFPIAGKLYLVLGGLPMGGAGTIQVWKSTNKGLTWAQQDSAHAPAYNNVNLPCGFTAKLRPDGTTILIGYMPQANAGPAGDGRCQAAWIDFRTAGGSPDTFSSASSPTMLTIANRMGTDCDFTVLPDNSVVFGFQHVTGGPNAVYQHWTGTWSAITTIQAGAVGNPGSVRSLVTDASGQVFVFGTYNGQTHFWKLAAGTLAVADSQDLGVDAFGNGGQALIWGNRVVFPVFESGADLGNTDVGVVVHIGTGLAGAPVFERDVLASYLGQGFLFSTTICMGWVESDASLHVAWPYCPAADPTVIQLLEAINEGAGFGVPQLLYDYTENPCNALPANQQNIGGISIAKVASAGAVLTVLDPVNTANVGYYLAQDAETVPTSQLVFHGVRRLPGPKPTLAPGCPYDPKSFTYRQRVTLTQAYPADAVRVFQTINDYDFDLYNLQFTYEPGGGALSRVVMQVLLFDAVKQQVSNLPVNDVYWNDAVANPYKVGALVPPLLYPANTQIRLDLYSMLKSTQLPVTVTIHLVGRQRIPV